MHIKKILMIILLGIFLSGCGLPQAIIWEISDEAYCKKVA